jgi:GNAT superfamily N-acetyltransferase
MGQSFVRVTIDDRLAASGKNRPALNIRTLAHSNLVDAAKFYHNCWHQTQAHLQDIRVASSRPEGFFRRRLENWFGTTRCAYFDSEIAGLVSWQDNMLEALYVADSRRGLRVGSSLLQVAEVEMAKTEKEHFELDCLLGNDVACRFYERQGWSVQSTQQHRTEVHDGVVMVRAWLMAKPKPRHPTG